MAIGTVWAGQDQWARGQRGRGGGGGREGGAREGGGGGGAGGRPVAAGARGGADVAPPGPARDRDGAADPAAGAARGDRAGLLRRPDPRRGRRADRPAARDRQ